MQAINWFPLGYQKVTDKQGNAGYQLRLYAELGKLGEFVNDPGGSVIGYELVNIDDVNAHINYGEVGDWLVNRIRPRYEKG